MADCWALLDSAALVTALGTVLLKSRTQTPE